MVITYFSPSRGFVFDSVCVCVCVCCFISCFHLEPSSTPFVADVARLIVSAVFSLSLPSFASHIHYYYFYPFSVDVVFVVVAVDLSCRFCCFAGSLSADEEGAALRIRCGFILPSSTSDDSLRNVLSLPHTRIQLRAFFVVVVVVMFVSTFFRIRFHHFIYQVGERESSETYSATAIRLVCRSDCTYDTGGSSMHSQRCTPTHTHTHTHAAMHQSVTHSAASDVDRSECGLSILFSVVKQCSNPRVVQTQSKRSL